MTVPVSGAKKKKNFWPSFLPLPPEIPAARLSCHTSGSLRPKLGLCILSIVLILAVLLVLVPLVADAPKMASPQQQQLQHKEAVKAVAAANQEFNARIYPSLVEAAGKDSNLVASPFSLSSVLAMLLSGTAGNTREQIRKGLSFPQDDKLVFSGYEDVTVVTKSNENFTLDAANRLYVQEGFPLLKEFLSGAAEHFKAEAESLNFADEDKSRKAINDWVEGKTNQKIRDLIPRGILNGLTRLVLVNAVYFKANWASKFDPKGTRPAKFTTLDGKEVEVDMMRKTAEYHLHRDRDMGCLVLKMPYVGGRLSMFFFLSDKPDEFEAMEAKVGGFDFNEMSKEGRQVKTDVAVPKFKLQTSHQLNEPLKKLGLTDMFEAGKADFSRLSARKEDLKVSSVVQKAFVEVNEEGTEAAAATGAVVMTRMAMVNPRFFLNRPFLFAIRDDLTGMLLFVGRVTNPKNE